MRSAGVLMFLLAAAPGFSGAPVAEESSVPSMIVSTSWLAECMEKEPASLVLLQVGPKEEYEAGHIPGAQHIMPADLGRDKDGVPLELLADGDYEEILRSKGIGDKSRVVIYFGKDWVTPTARVYWTLDYLGLAKQTAILDGGLPAWRAEGRAVSVETPKVATGNYKLRTRPEIRVDADWVNSHCTSPEIALVDTRTADFFSGENDGRGRYPRPGHIPGASNIPYPNVIEKDLKFKDVESLRQIFRAADAGSGKRVVTYCHIGQQASLVYFIAKYLGYDAAMYDGSFTEWTLNELPVERSESKSKPE
ncbi:MAG: sulfurtransferase [Gammaproteobacteria bacterium]